MLERGSGQPNKDLYGQTVWHLTLQMVHAEDKCVNKYCVLYSFVEGHEKVSPDS